MPTRRLLTDPDPNYKPRNSSIHYENSATQPGKTIIIQLKINFKKLEKTQLQLH